LDFEFRILCPVYLQLICVVFAKIEKGAKLMMMGKTIDELKVGDSAEFSKTISESDIYIYAGVTGDLNPAHVNEEYASKTFFKTRIAHGALMVGFISAVLGNKLPGPGSIHIHHELDFLAPVRIGDTITARVEVVEIIAEKNRVRLKVSCVNQEGVVVVAGEALTSPPKRIKEQ
jgi:3-hydroxybutyryl-CoA dehydratase